MRYEVHGAVYDTEYPPIRDKMPGTPPVPEEGYPEYGNVHVVLADCKCDSQYPHGHGVNFQCPLVIPFEEWKANKEFQYEQALKAPRTKDPSVLREVLNG